MQQLRAIAFAIRQQAELLENLGMQMLRLVDHEDRRRIHWDERREEAMQHRDEVMAPQTLNARRVRQQHAEVLQNL